MLTYMAELTIIQRSPDPEQVAQSRTRRSIAEKIRGMGQNRIGALILLLATLAAIIWANVSVGSYEAFWETHLTVGVGDIQLDFTLHALVNDALMAIFFFTVGLEVRREFAIGELTSWSRAMVPVRASQAHAFRVGATGMTPTDGRNPTTLQNDAGFRKEPPMSVPSASGTMRSSWFLTCSSTIGVPVVTMVKRDRCFSCSVSETVSESML